MSDEEILPESAMTAAELNGTTSGMTWAEQFAIYAASLTKTQILDHGLLVGWFANAIEAGRTAGMQDACSHSFDSLFIADDLIICRNCGKELSERHGPTLDETDPNLTAVLNSLFDDYGTAGVAHTVSMMQAERLALVTFAESVSSLSNETGASNGPAPTEPTG